MEALRCTHVPVQEPFRYRVEGGEAVIDVKITNVDQLFDKRDPSPFRERDLDPGLAQYLLDAGEDLIGRGRHRVVFWLDQPCPPGEIEQAYRAHFEDVLGRLRRKRLRQRRTGQLALLLGVLLLSALLSLTKLLEGAWTGSLGTGIREGLVIASWVVMWRPVEVLVYDWIPARHEQKVVAQVLAAPIEVRMGKTTIPPSSPPSAAAVSH